MRKKKGKESSSCTTAALKTHDVQIETGKEMRQTVNALSMNCQNSLRQCRFSAEGWIKGSQ